MYGLCAARTWCYWSQPSVLVAELISTCIYHNMKRFSSHFFFKLSCGVYSVQVKTMYVYMYIIYCFSYFVERSLPTSLTSCKAQIHGRGSRFFVTSQNCFIHIIMVCGVQFEN